MRNIPHSRTEWCSIYNGKGNKDKCKRSFIQYDTSPPTYQACQWRSGSSESFTCSLDAKLSVCENVPPAAPSPMLPPAPPSAPPSPFAPTLCEAVTHEKVSIRDLPAPQWCHDLASDHAACENAYVRLGQTYMSCIYDAAHDSMGRFSPTCAMSETKLDCQLSPPAPPSPPSVPATCPQAAATGFSQDLRYTPEKLGMSDHSTQEWNAKHHVTSLEHPMGHTEYPQCDMYAADLAECRISYQTDGVTWYPCYFQTSPLTGATTCKGSPMARTCHSIASPRTPPSPSSPPSTPPPTPAADGTVTTYAGGGTADSTDGIGTAARFNGPVGVAISPDGTFALVADRDNHRIRKVVINAGSIDSGMTSTLAGDGTAASTDDVGVLAQFNAPVGVAISPDSSFALVAEKDGNTIRKVVIATGATTTLAGSGAAASTNGVGTTAAFKAPLGVAISPDGNFALVADSENNQIRKIIIASGLTTRFAGDASGDPGSGDDDLRVPVGVAIAPDGTFALVADNMNHRIRKIVIAAGGVAGAMSTLAGSSGNIGARDRVGALATFNGPVGVAISPDSSFALVAESANHKIRKVVIATGATTTFTGASGGADAAGFSDWEDGVKAVARFASPFGVAIEPIPTGTSAGGTFALVADSINHRIRRVHIAT